MACVCLQSPASSSLGVTTNTVSLDMAISPEARTHRSSWRLFAVALSLLSLVEMATPSRCSVRTLSPFHPHHHDLVFSRCRSLFVCGMMMMMNAETGEVFAWGSNEQGQLGLGEFSSDPIRTPQQVHFFDCKRVMSIHCGDNFSGAVLSASSSCCCCSWHSLTSSKSHHPLSFHFIAHHHQHTESGELFLWGENSSGQLGTGDKENRATPTLVTANLAAKRVLSIELGFYHTTALIQ